MEKRQIIIEILLALIVLLMVVSLADRFAVERKFDRRGQIGLIMIRAMEDGGRGLTKEEAETVERLKIEAGYPPETK